MARGVPIRAMAGGSHELSRLCDSINGSRCSTPSPSYIADRVSGELAYFDVVVSKQSQKARDGGCAKLGDDGGSPLLLARDAGTIRRHAHQSGEAALDGLRARRRDEPEPRD